MSEFSELLEDHFKDVQGTNFLSIGDKVAAAILSDPTKHATLQDKFLKIKTDSRDLAFLRHVYEKIEAIPSSNFPLETSAIVYRGTPTPPDMVLKNGGISVPQIGTKSIMKHKSDTAGSVYVSTSESLGIALEHACQRQHEQKFVYKINASGGIRTNDYLAPLSIHNVEQEVVFAGTIPLRQILGVAYAVRVDKLATEFYPLEQVGKFYDELATQNLIYKK